MPSRVLWMGNCAGGSEHIKLWIEHVFKVGKFPEGNSPVIYIWLANFVFCGVE